MTSKKKLSFFYPQKQDMFLRPIIDDLSNDYDVHEWTGGDDQYFYRTIHGSDICWFEWGTDIAAQVSHLPEYSKYIIRIHSYEVFDGWHHRINWNKISKLILVNDSVKDLIQKGIPGALGPVPPTPEEAAAMGAPMMDDNVPLHLPPDKIKVIYHGFDANKFPFNENRPLKKSVALIGYLNHKKGPELALATMAAIHAYDPEFVFHIVGIHQELRYVLYFQHLLSQEPFRSMKVMVHGWQEDVRPILAEVGFVLSTSIFESYHMTLMEGMVSGCIPLVHNWYGSANIYPRKYIWNTIPECVGIVDKFVKMNDEQRATELKVNRMYVERMFPFSKQMKEIRKVLEAI